MGAADAAMICAALLAGVGAWAAVRTIDRLRTIAGNLECEIGWNRDVAEADRARADRATARAAWEADLADSRLRTIVREREEHAAAQQEVETLRAQLARAVEDRDDALREVRQEQDRADDAVAELEHVRRQLHEVIEGAGRLRRERDEARNRVRWVRRQDPPARADARLLRVVVGGQAALLTEERLAEGHRRAEIVAGAWRDEG